MRSPIPRFRLRTILIAVAVVGIACGLIRYLAIAPVTEGKVAVQTVLGLCFIGALALPIVWGLLYGLEHVVARVLDWLGINNPPHR